ncbi:MAG TPA: single-stranded DNA-binding protein [Candidatus Latescibacteria bacterium]|nr:single-stranded DNA-binding protein [Candidatus Latescibacterota bacterium]HQI75089.1 single-stranded DNA-binding protein [Candidatus Latescibacterota bacterium]HQK22301.1 single-stranded DNA-binding protein [Candidatus Latescibacterota bacterium]HRU22764.1 single-stranded DNA-binding protein [Candidatus Latescibacterota bacterium]
MASVNKVILIGNLGKDPVVDQTPSGTPRCRFSLATSENFTDREGKKQERTEWHNILIWGKLAEVAGQYLRKGRPVYLEGRIAYRSYEDQEGNKKNFTEIVVTSMQLLGSRSDQSGYDSDVPPPEEPLSSATSAPRRGAPPRKQKETGIELPEDMSAEDEDLPF